MCYCYDTINAKISKPKQQQCDGWTVLHPDLTHDTVMKESWMQKKYKQLRKIIYLIVYLEPT